jgi:hypothetical protein
MKITVTDCSVLTFAFVSQRDVTIKDIISKEPNQTMGTNIPNHKGKQISCRIQGQSLHSLSYPDLLNL